MFGLFANKKKKLEKRYAQLLEQSHHLSHSDRKASDLKMAEAEEVLDQIKAIEQVSTDSSAHSDQQLTNGGDVDINDIINAFRVTASHYYDNWQTSMTACVEDEAIA